MARFVPIPPERLEAATLTAMLEEFASRDGTDYGFRELTLEEKVDELRSRLVGGDLRLIYDLAGDQWELVDRDRAAELL